MNSTVLKYEKIISSSNELNGSVNTVQDGVVVILSASKGRKHLYLPRDQL